MKFELVNFSEVKSVTRENASFPRETSFTLIKLHPLTTANVYYITLTLIATTIVSIVFHSQIPDSRIPRSYGRATS